MFHTLGSRGSGAGLAVLRLPESFRARLLLYIAAACFSAAIDYIVHAVFAKSTFHVNAEHIASAILRVILTLFFAFLLESALRRLEREFALRKRSEEELRETDLLFKTMFEYAMDGILLSETGSGVVQWANPTLCKMLGYGEKEMNSLTLARLHTAGSMDAIRSIYQNVPAGGQQRPSDVEMQKKDGTVFYADISVAPVVLGERSYLACIFRDVTARRENEAKYRRISQEFDALLKAIPDRLTLLASDFTVVWVNRTAMGSEGSGSIDTIGKCCYTARYQREVPCDACPVARCFRSGAEESQVVSEADGGMRELRAVPVRDEQNAVVNVILVERDITEHRRLEEQLRQSQKIETVGQLAGGIAHDFNNILTAIIGYANLLDLRMGKDDPLKLYVEQILLSAEKAAGLTHGLLAFSRKQIINPKPVEVNTVIRKIEKLLRRLIGEDIEFVVQLFGEQLAVMADAGQIEQVLINLVTNARDAMPQGGLLTVGTEAVIFDDEYVKYHAHAKPGAYAMISVTDTGEGMDEQTRQHIFEPFFTTKELGKGTGLGLSVAYGIVKQHKGYIHVYSEKGRGTTFRIYLPLLSEPVSVQEEKRKLEPPHRGNETLLIAEDDATLRKLAKTVLEEFGYEVIESADGNEAVSRFRDNIDRIAMVILDVVMPGKNGKDAYDEIRAMRPHTRALFMSGYTADIIHKKGILDESIAFIFKPVSPHDLLREVRKLLDQPAGRI